MASEETMVVAVIRQMYLFSIINKTIVGVGTDLTCIRNTLFQDMLV